MAVRDPVAQKHVIEDGETETASVTISDSDRGFEEEMAEGEISQDVVELISLVGKVAAGELPRTLAVEAIRRVADLCYGPSAGVDRRQFQLGGGVPALLSCLEPGEQSGLQRDPAVVRWAVEVLGLLVSGDSQARTVVIEGGAIGKLEALLAAGTAVGRDTVHHEAVSRVHRVSSSMLRHHLPYMLHNHLPYMLHNHLPYMLHNHLPYMLHHHLLAHHV
eukprot:SAG31_NODE_1964_length_6799_cov_2.549552_2_plen_219_part_00